MEPIITVSELRRRRDRLFKTTGQAVAAHPATYKQIKSVVTSIIDRPLDITDYVPTVEKLIHLLEAMDPCHGGTIFDRFIDRFSPHSAWLVGHLRVECRDLMAYLHDFDQWRLKRHHLRVIE